MYVPKTPFPNLSSLCVPPSLSLSILFVSDYWKRREKRDQIAPSSKNARDEKAKDLHHGSAFERPRRPWAVRWDDAPHDPPWQTKQNLEIQLDLRQSLADCHCQCLCLFKRNALQTLFTETIENLKTYLSVWSVDVRSQVVILPN